MLNSKCLCDCKLTTKHNFSDEKSCDNKILAYRASARQPNTGSFRHVKTLQFERQLPSWAVALEMWHLKFSTISSQTFQKLPLHRNSFPWISGHLSVECTKFIRNKLPSESVIFRLFSLNCSPATRELQWFLNYSSDYNLWYNIFYWNFCRKPVSHFIFVFNWPPDPIKALTMTPR